MSPNTFEKFSPAKQRLVSALVHVRRIMPAFNVGFRARRFSAQDKLRNLRRGHPERSEGSSVGCGVTQDDWCDRHCDCEVPRFTWNDNARRLFAQDKLKSIPRNA